MDLILVLKWHQPDDPVQARWLCWLVREYTVLSLAVCLPLLLIFILRSSFGFSLPFLGCLHPMPLSQPKLKHVLMATTLLRRSLNICHFQRKEPWWFVYRTCAQHRHFINPILVSVYFSHLRLMKKVCSAPWEIFFSPGTQFPPL